MPLYHFWHNVVCTCSIIYSTHSEYLSIGRLVAFFKYYIYENIKCRINRRYDDNAYN